MSEPSLSTSHSPRCPDCGAAPCECDLLAAIEDLRDDDGEPVGSCEACGVNLYGDGVSEWYCDQCAWAAGWHGE